MSKRLRVAVLGEKPQGAEWLRLLLESELFEVVCGVPRHLKGEVWWESDEFRSTLEQHGIPIIKRDELAQFSYDVIWSLMYGFIIEREWIEKAQFGINLHESPLPKYRGCNGYSHAILAGDQEYGTTLQLLHPELDRGDLIDQELFPIDPDITAKELYLQTQQVSRQLFARNLQAISSGDFPRRKMEVESEPIRPRHSLMEEKELDPNLPFELVYKKVRALDFPPFTPATFMNKGETYYLFINDSEGRNNHSSEAIEAEWDGLPQEQLMILSKGNRKVVAMHENLYSQHYPIYYSAAERKVRSQTV